jgi:hypothetical protein
MQKRTGTSVVIAVGLALFVGSVLWLVVSPSVTAALVVAFAVFFLIMTTRDYLRRGVASTRVADPEVTVPGGPLRVGEEFGLGYRQTWKRATVVSRIRFELVLRETVRYTTQSSTNGGTSTQTVTKTHDQVAQGFTTAGRRFEPGQSINEDHRFRVPADAMHTFTAADNRIEWYLMVCVEMDRWPDYRWEHQLTVLPELLR